MHAQSLKAAGGYEAVCTHPSDYSQYSASLNYQYRLALSCDYCFNLVTAQWWIQWDSPAPPKVTGVNDLLFSFVLSCCLPAIWVGHPFMVGTPAGPPLERPCVKLWICHCCWCVAQAVTTAVVLLVLLVCFVVVVVIVLLIVVYLCSGKNGRRRCGLASAHRWLWRVLSRCQCRS